MLVLPSMWLVVDPLGPDDVMDRYGLPLSSNT